MEKLTVHRFNGAFDGRPVCGYINPKQISWIEQKSGECYYLHMSNGDVLEIPEWARKAPFLMHSVFYW